MGRFTTRRQVLRYDDARAVRRPDTVAVEEPFEIRVDGASVSVTMRTPGDDFDLAAGLLVTEGVVRAAGEIATMRFCADTETLNVVDVAVRTGSGTPVALPTSLGRTLPASSACGICGKTSIDSVRVKSSHQVAADPLRVLRGALLAMPDTMREAQRGFAQTGGLHAAGIFTPDGELRCLREDVGRHNAVDKVIGWAYRAELLPLTGHLLVVSGRASFELTQKALMAGIPLLAAVSAPSSLAIDLAADAGLTLVGFLRGRSMNVYTAAHRLTA